jgi:opacity protein-like surface antigen
MNNSMKAGFATAALAVAAFAAPALSADLGGYGQRGSVKDSGYEPPAYRHAEPRGPAGNCYVRGDLGYSLSRSPSVKWAVTSFDRTYDGVDLATSTTYTDSNHQYLGDSVTNTHMENGAFGGVGLGCGMGSYGIRGEVMLNTHASRKIDGVPGNFFINEIFTGPVVPATPTQVVDPLHTSVKSTTLMFNAYKDMGNFGGFTPYVGAGVGVAYNKMSDVYFTDNQFLHNRIQGDSRLSLAWALMAGVGYQVTDRAVLDFGYRYMNFGKAQSGQIDSEGFINPIVKINDLSAHEFKVGLRYHFGGNDCCAQASYQPMK